MSPDANVIQVPSAVLPWLAHLAPGVVGYTVEHAGTLYVPLIVAEHPGAGDVGRYLDRLPRDRRVCVPTVLSSRLAGMLARRGFTYGTEYDAETQSTTEVWVREPA